MRIAEAEHEIGIWTDGRKLYETTLELVPSDLPTVGQNAMNDLNHGISNIYNPLEFVCISLKQGEDTFSKMILQESTSRAYSQDNQFLINMFTRTQVRFRRFTNAASETDYIYLVLRYTKTTDTPSPSHMVDTSDATAVASEILASKTAYARGSKLTGTMTNRGAVSQTINPGESYTVPEGYHNGSGTVTANGSGGATGNATVSDVLAGKTFSNSSETGLEGTMPNIGAVSQTINPGGSYNVPEGYHDGTGTVTANMASGDAVAGDVLTGKTFSNSSANGVSGTMSNNGTVTSTITTKSQSVSIAQGYHSGSGSVSIDSTEQAKIIPENIASGITILGVEGTHSGGGGGGATGNAVAADVLAGKTFSNAQATGIEGTMVNRGAQIITIDDVLDNIAISAGYHNGSGTVSLDSAEAAKIIADNIKSGVSILGVTGSFLGFAAALIPLEYDYNIGWVGAGKWTYENPTNTYNDIYEVEAGKTYYIRLGANVGTRFRGMFTTVDIRTITSGSVQGTQVVNTSNPAANASVNFTTTQAGYIIISKDNVGKSGIFTYVYDTAVWA